MTFGKKNQHSTYLENWWNIEVKKVCPNIVGIRVEHLQIHIINYLGNHRCKKDAKYTQNIGRKTGHTCFIDVGLGDSLKSQK